MAFLDLASNWLKLILSWIKEAFVRCKQQFIGGTALEREKD
jgi:hypothetical protein